jgi:hypothetical protein
MLTLMDCVIIYCPRNVCPGFKWYCCSLVFVCWTWRRTGWDRPVNHLAHMYVLWINGFYNLSVNIILIIPVFYVLTMDKFTIASCCDNAEEPDTRSSGNYGKLGPTVSSVSAIISSLIQSRMKEAKFPEYCVHTWNNARDTVKYSYS